MAVSEAKRRANARWNKENTTVVGAQIKKEEARRFKEACSQSGEIPGRVLRTAMNDYALRVTGKPLFDREPWDTFVQAHVLSAAVGKEDDL